MLPTICAILVSWFIIQILCSLARPREKKFDHKQHQRNIDQFQKDFNGYCLTLSPARLMEVTRIMDSGRSQSEMNEWQRSAILSDIQIWKVS